MNYIPSKEFSHGDSVRAVIEKGCPILVEGCETPKYSLIPCVVEGVFHSEDVPPYAWIELEGGYKVLFDDNTRMCEKKAL